ncbi:MAG: DUF5125 domain-containing protein [Bacteroides sp.]|nr:DUF5125 domain-containing protein [Bacteroides sp.]
MNPFKSIILTALAVGALAACSDEPGTGNPVIDVRNDIEDVCYGDSLPFTVKASDTEVALSTLKARLYYGDEMVSETIIRTKESDKDYSGKIFVPYLADKADGQARLVLLLQNIKFTITEKEYTVGLTHPDYPYLTLEDGEGNSYRLERKERYNYAFTGKMPQKVKGLIRAPKSTPNGNELTFGYRDNRIVEGSTDGIPFSNSRAGKYTITFNSYSLIGSPFVVLKLNGQEMASVDDNNSALDLNIAQGDILSPEGFPEYEDWIIDTDFFTQNPDGSLTFKPIGGSYRVLANSQLKTLIVRPLLNGEPARLQEDGSGGLWIIGTGFGKPSMGSNEVGWSPERAYALAQVHPGVYQVTCVAGKSLSIDDINFKFFYEMSWNGCLEGSDIHSTSDLIKTGMGQDIDGHDPGNLYLAEGVTLEPNAIYTLTVDVTAGIHDAVLSVTKNGFEEFVEKKVNFCGTPLTTSDNSIYTGIVNLSQKQELSIEGTNVNEMWWLDPDYFSYDNETGKISFRPVEGEYLITLNRANATLQAARMENGQPAVMTPDYRKALYLRGWGACAVSFPDQIGWDEKNAFCMAEIEPGVFRYTAQGANAAAPSVGERLSYDWFGIKFFWQKGDGGEFSNETNLKLTDRSSEWVTLSETGDVNLVDGKQLTIGNTYQITVYLSEGLEKGTIDFIEIQ